MNTGWSVCVVDVGKPGKNLGWAMEGLSPCDGVDLDECVATIAGALTPGPVAPGFEAPKFTPLRASSAGLTKARSGETAGGVSRPFSASAGATVLVTALVVVPYVLQRLRAFAPNARATLDWRRPLTGRADLLLFEAFVTNQRKTSATRHVEDARLAIAAFQTGMADCAKFVSAISEPDVLNLLGAAMLPTGWSEDISVVENECLVVRA